LRLWILMTGRWRPRPSSPIPRPRGSRTALLRAPGRRRSGPAGAVRARRAAGLCSRHVSNVVTRPYCLGGAYLERMAGRCLDRPFLCLFRSQRAVPGTVAGGRVLPFRGRPCGDG
jgi:hypothetical protein